MNVAVDASAVLAILLDEPDASVHATKLFAAEASWISPVNWWEVHVRAVAELGPVGEARASDILAVFRVQVEPITLDHARIALAAFTRYRGRPARLNLGDCFAYALAKTKGVPLLYKGNDFANTDIESA